MRPLVLSLLLVGACTTKRTEVVIGVATNLDAPAQMSSVQMTVSRDGVPLVEQTWDLPGIPAGQYELPGAFGVYSDDGSEPRIEVELVGILGTQQLVHRRAIFVLVKEQTLFLRLTLVDSCVNRTDCNPDQTCVEGKCAVAAIDSRTFPAYTKGMESYVSCSGAIVYKDTGTKQPMQVMGGCAANETCSEGTCLKMAAAGSDGGVPDVGMSDGGPTGPARFAYVANPGANEIRVFTCSVPVVSRQNRAGESGRVSALLPACHAADCLLPLLAFRAAQLGTPLASSSPAPDGACARYSGAFRLRGPRAAHRRSPSRAARRPPPSSSG